MTDLHIALLILAAVLLALLVAYNKWQERQALKRLGQSLRGASGELDDALLQTPAVARIEPAPGSSAGMPPARIEPRLAPVDGEPVASGSAGSVDLDIGAPVDASAAASEPPAATAATPAWVEDPLIDWVLELRCAHAVDGVTVFDAAAPLARIDSPLPVFLVAWDARSQQWVQPDRFGFYAEMLVATQLAHRRHKLDAILASRFIATLQQVAMALDADFDAPDVNRVVQLADDLDRLCAQFDVQIGLTLVAQGGTWDAVAINRATETAQLVRGDGLRWDRLSADGAPVFSLTAEGVPADRLLMELDVPLAPVAATPLRSMAAAAGTLAAQLNAQIVDDNGRPVDAAALDGIVAQLDGLYAEMRAAGIEPGGARARRLYA